MNRMDRPRADELQSTVWFTHNDEESFHLQIELGNDHGILLSFREGEPPSVSLCDCSGSMLFADQNPETVAERIAEARQRRARG